MAFHVYNLALATFIEKLRNDDVHLLAAFNNIEGVRKFGVGVP